MRGDVGLDHLSPADLDVQRRVAGAKCAVAEIDAIGGGRDVHLGPGGVIVPGTPVHAGAADFIGQPGPAALHRRGGGDGQGAFDGGFRVIADGRVELHDDRRCDADHLAVGELELPVDSSLRIDGGEAPGQWDRLAVAADR